MFRVKVSNHTTGEIVEKNITATTERVAIREFVSYLFFVGFLGKHTTYSVEVEK